MSDIGRHTAKAEEFNYKAEHYLWGDGADPVVGAGFAQMAQVHATLALVAATVEYAPGRIA